MVFNKTVKDGRNSDLMDINLIFEGEFRKSKAFNEWHDSLVDLVGIGFEPVKEFLDKYADPEPKRKSSLTEEEIKEYESRINASKIAHITKSIELGIYFQKLAKKELISLD